MATLKELFKIEKNKRNLIINKIRAGKAHEISEGDTNYLGACTKGANADSVREQPFNSIVAKQRAFCLKPATSYVLVIFFNSSIYIAHFP